MASLLLVDGSSYLYRAFYASQKANLRTKDGFPTGAIRVIVNMLKSLLKEQQSDYIAVVFDAPGKNFRHELYTDYKANRPAMPDELRQQIEPIHQMIKAMGLPLLSVSGVEADDVIGTLAYWGGINGLDITISSGDKDMSQLVNQQVKVIDTMNNYTFDREGVIAKFEVEPEQIVDYLALVGDTSDNIPGVPKCGHKTAVKWLNAYGSLKKIMVAADQVKGKIGENLRASLEQLPLSYELATIKKDLELGLELQDLIQGSENKEALRELYDQYEFFSLIEKMEPTTEQPQAKKVEKNYQTLLTKEQFSLWLEKLKQAKAFAFDTETTSLDYMQAQIVGVSFAIEPNCAAYVPCAHSYLGAPVQLPLEWVLAQLKPLLEDPTQLKIGQNLKYDRSVLLNYGLCLNGIGYDSMLESYVLNSIATRHDMDSMAERYLGEKTVKFEDIAGKGVKQLSFDQIEVEQASSYASEDADITLQLHQHLWPQLQEKPAQKKLFCEIEMPLVPILSDIERHGTLIDQALLHQQSQALSQRLGELQEQAFELVGHEFNLSSPKQLTEILYNQQGLPVLKKTPKGAPSTAEGVLQELAYDYPLPKLLIEHRGLSKLKSTYTDKLPKRVSPATGRIHTSYHQAVTATGRLSSSDPNLQNIPIRTEQGRKIRQAFIAPKGYCLLAADYSQIELRIMAHLSADKTLLEAFANNQDIHSITAAQVFDVAPEQVNREQRRQAKAINFGLIYGMSAFGLAKQIGTTRQLAQSYIDLYFERYPGVKNYMDSIRVKAKEQGYVETLYGRRLYLPDINAKQVGRRQAAERTAINAPMQGSAADIIKMAMIRVHQKLKAHPNQAAVIMQVHDELVLEVQESALDPVKSMLKQAMEQVADLSVPMLVEMGEGKNWDEAH